MTKQRETAPPPQEVEEKEAAPPSADFALTPEQATFLLQSGMLLLAVFVVLYVAKAIILPVILAFVLKLLMNPAFRWLQRLGLPRVLGALLLLVALSATIVGLAAALSGPAVDWFAKLPGGIPRLQERLEFLRQPVEIFRRFLTAMRGLAPLDSAVVAIPTSEGTLPDQLFAGTWNFAAGLFTTGLLLFFLMISGDTFLRKLVEILPSFSEKRQAVEMSQQIESDISAYLATVTIMNAAVGIATGLVMWACGVGDPVLWGAVVFLLDYVPIPGAAAGNRRVRPGRPTHHGHAVGGAAAGRPLSRRSRGGGRGRHADAAGQALHPQPRAGDPGPGLLVPDVGRARRHPRRAFLAITKIVCNRIQPPKAFGRFLGDLGVPGASARSLRKSGTRTACAALLP